MEAVERGCSATGQQICDIGEASCRLVPWVIVLGAAAAVTTQQM